MSKNDEQCYLCGKSSKSLTRDHIPPACLFPKPRPSNLITLPCCTDCQKEYQKDEEYFRTNISAISDVGTNKSAKAIWQKAYRSLVKRPTLGRELTSRMFQVNIVSPSDLYVRTAEAIRISPSRIEKVLRKIALGLFYHHTQSWLPDGCTVSVFFQPEEHFLDLLKEARYVGDFKEVFFYAGVIANDTISSMWWMRFYRSVGAIVIIRSPAKADVNDVISL